MRSPSFPPSSFDPAIHSEHDLNTDPALDPGLDANPGTEPLEQFPSEPSFADELEALQLVREENIRNKVVIQHRAWNLSDVFRSDEDIRPETPTKPHRLIHHSIGTVPLLPSSPPVAAIAKMPFIVPSRVPSPTDSQKRKNDEMPRPMEPQPGPEPKRPRITGGFVDEDDEGEDSDSDMAAFGDASQFDIPEASAKVTETFQWPRASSPTPVTGTAPVPENGSQRNTPKQTRIFNIKTCSGKTHNVPTRTTKPSVSYERLVAGRSTAAPGRAQKAYYGIEIHRLLDDAAKEAAEQSNNASSAAPPVQQSIEPPMVNPKKQKLAHAMWTEKYRARKFTELIGDERTHRSVLKWFKGWDPVVFPGLAKAKRPQKSAQNDDEEERVHRKVLLLCGPPGLGKTTLAHVCARQAGYEVLEINASDDRSKDVVKGRIRNALGTENVKGMNVEVGESKVRKVGRPVCVVVDEVDGVVSGSGGGGEGGFMKALIDLVLLDQKNSSRSAQSNGNGATGKKKKGDNFRFLRPLILVCNDVYHPSLRPLRASSIAEMIHVRQAPMENVVSRMKSIFTREGVPCENDGVRRLCEASWGLSSKKQGPRTSGTAEGDIRSVLVAGEWVAHKLRNENASSPKLTRSWLEQRVLCGSTEGGSFFKGLNRGGVRDIVDRVFKEGAGFPNTPVAESLHDPFLDSDQTPVGVANLRKGHAIRKLCEMVDVSGDHDRCVSECFASYPIQSYQDDTYLSKPNAAYDWLHFHDIISSKVFSNQDWELAAYLSHSVAAFHHLFASARGKSRLTEKDEDEAEEHPFSGPRADFAAFEAQKQNRATITGFQSSLSVPLSRLFRSTESVVIDLVPNLMRILSPDVKPVVVRGSGEQKSVASVRKESERVLVQAAVRAMIDLGVTFEKIRVEGDGGAHGGWAYRMEPPLDSLVTFSRTKGTTLCTSGSAPVRYAVRQVLDQEYRKEQLRKHTSALNPTNPSSKKKRKSDGENEGEISKDTMKDLGLKRDFFGRVVEQQPQTSKGPSEGGGGSGRVSNEASKAGRRVWVTYHDGYSNAVRKPISIGELLGGL